MDTSLPASLTVTLSREQLSDLFYRWANSHWSAADEAAISALYQSARELCALLGKCDTVAGVLLGQGNSILAGLLVIDFMERASKAA